MGESIQYARTNSTKTNYLTQLQLFKTRLIKRGYPSNFIEKYTSKIRYENRNSYIQKQITTITSPIKHRPLLKCPLPPRYKLLQEIVLSKFETIQHLTNKPIFIYTNHNTVKRYLVNSKHPSDTTTILNIYSSCHNEYEKEIPQAKLIFPKLSHINRTQPSPCHQKRCTTCQHFNSNQHFNCTVTRRKYRIRHNFTCSSNNIIYLITCKKCKKQYVGKTTKRLKDRIVRHRASIKSQQKVYLSKHFCLPNHNIQDLTVQPIDTTTPDKLDRLEQYWINTLHTLIPKGLNVKYD